MKNAKLPTIKENILASRHSNAPTGEAAIDRDTRASVFAYFNYWSLCVRSFSQGGTENRETDWGFRFPCSSQRLQFIAVHQFYLCHHRLTPQQHPWQHVCQTRQRFHNSLCHHDWLTIAVSLCRCIPTTASLAIPRKDVASGNIATNSWWPRQ